MKRKRITVSIPTEVNEKLESIAQKEKRSVSFTAGMLIEDSLNQPESAMSYQERVAADLVKKKEG